MNNKNLLELLSIDVIATGVVICRWMREQKKSRIDRYFRMKERLSRIIVAAACASVALAAWSVPQQQPHGDIPVPSSVSTKAVAACIEYYRSGNIAAARETCRPEAEKEDGNALLIMGLLELRKIDDFSDVKAAIPWLQQSVKTGNTIAKSVLGRIYISDGFQNYPLAKQYLADAAGQGNPEAQYNLGYLYEAGHGVPKDLKKAFALTQQAAEGNFPEAQYKLGLLYQDGTGVKRDIGLSARWIIRAAENGFPRAQNKYGTLLQSGTGVQMDLQQARYWFRKSAEQGDEVAQGNLGVFLLEGKGGAVDLDEGRELLKKSAAAGFVDAQHELGWRYLQGLRLEKDESAARSWFEKASMQGHDKAQFLLGGMYRDGRGGAQDFEQARYWFEKSAKTGNLASRTDLAELYRKGLGGAKDVPLAFRMFTTAAEEGFSVAQYNLGYMYMNGEGTAPDLSRAADLFKKAVADPQVAPHANNALKELARRSMRQLDYNQLKMQFESGRAALEAGNGPQAETTFRKLVKLHPNDYLFQIGLGISLSIQKRYAESFKVFEQAIAIEPGKAEAYKNLGYALAQSGDYAKAISMYNRALEIDPLDERTRANRRSAQFSVE